jgi:hypothetical protein
MKGDALASWEISGSRSETHTSTWNWPKQQTPPKANLHRVASGAKLMKSMEVWHLPNDFWITLGKCVAHTTNQTGTMTNAPLPFTISMNPGCMQLREAFKEHSKIGWINASKGHLFTRWQDYVASHLKKTKLR